MQSPSHAKPTVKILSDGVHWCFCVHLLPLQKYLREFKELFFNNIICIIKISKYQLFLYVLIYIFLAHNERNANAIIHFDWHWLNEGIQSIENE